MKTPCKNCGSFPENVDPQRERLGFCPPCWKGKKKLLAEERADECLKREAEREWRRNHP